LEENPALEDLSLTINEPEEQYPDRDPDEDTYNGDEEKGPKWMSLILTITCRMIT
jgi:RNA polymerase sigma-54 factor